MAFGGPASPTFARFRRKLTVHVRNFGKAQSIPFSLDNLKNVNQTLAEFSLHYCYVKITIFHPVVSKIKLRFYLKPGNREPMFECWDESGSEHPDMVPHRGIVDIDIFQMSIYRTSICHIDQG